MLNERFIFWFINSCCYLITSNSSGLKSCQHLLTCRKTLRVYIKSLLVKLLLNVWIWFYACQSCCHYPFYLLIIACFCWRRLIYNITLKLVLRLSWIFLRKNLFWRSLWFIQLLNMICRNLVWNFSWWWNSIRSRTSFFLYICLVAECINLSILLHLNNLI